jgi:hypothetical protein
MLKWADLGELYAQLRTNWVFSCSSKLPDKVREKTWLRFTLLALTPIAAMASALPEDRL